MVIEKMFSFVCSSSEFKSQAKGILETISCRMIPMHSFYGNQTVHRCSDTGFNYNQYYSSFCPNSNSLLLQSPRTLMPPSIEHNANLNIRQSRFNSSRNSVVTAQKAKNDIISNDFLTFIEQKTKSVSELNPFANEFSLVKNNINNPVVTKNNGNNSSYKLIFDDLIEQSLQSIEAIKKGSKTICVNHVSTQCNPSTDQINRSTQTNDDNDQHNLLLKEYSSHTVKLMSRLDEHFKYLLLLVNDNAVRHQLHLTSYLLDQLRNLLFNMNEIITLGKSSENGDQTVNDLSIQSSPMIFGSGGRMHRWISPSFSSRQIDSITMVSTKVCLLCQKPVDDSDDVMHPLCRLLSSPQGR